MEIYFIDWAWSVLGRFHQDGGAETGWCDEGWRELGQPLLSEPLQRCIQTSSYWYSIATFFCIHIVCSWESLSFYYLPLQTWWWACQSQRTSTPYSVRRKSMRKKRRKAREELRSRSASCCRPTCSSCCPMMRSFMEVGPSSIVTWG